MYQKEVPGSTHIGCDAYNPLLTFDPHGVRSGWVNYPYDFDPIWMQNTCKQFRPKGKEDLIGRQAGLGFATCADDVSQVLKIADRMPASMLLYYGFNSAMFLVGAAMNNSNEKTNGESDEKN